MVLVAPPYEGTISNPATVDPNTATFEADETNNPDTESTLVSTGIDLTILKNFRWGENYNIQFGAEMFNATNTHNFVLSNAGRLYAFTYPEAQF